ncbi:hypothetical protein B0H16DRAFT_1749695 [Mycena metata]|uniref:Transmembrane protein n=1 Tax=Mycena metata TaxID=1033252 RepID=A0AAD7DT06_9AGAR|nr:hypothetical protein B0H16DRAFT_1749695 [Mycena metata]
MSLFKFRFTGRRTAGSDSEDDSSQTSYGDAQQKLKESTMTLLRVSREEHKTPGLNSYHLRLLSLTMHFTLVIIHITLIVIWAGGLEHRVIFSLKNQKIVSFAVTAIATTVGTIYFALLVFLTQRLSIRRSLRMNQTLTATHDNAAAWAGIGSAISHLWHQKAVPASTFGVLCVFLYLGNILILHVTTPALFALEAFNSFHSGLVETQGLPTFNDTRFNLSSPLTGELQGFWDRVNEYATPSLYFLPSVVGSTTNLGLYNGTLYDVLNDNDGVGNVTVDATGFNITCGSLADVSLGFLAEGPASVWWASTATNTANIESSLPRVIVMSNVADDSGASVFLYSTIPIVDSSNTRGPSITLDPPMNTSVSTIQYFRCSQTVVRQSAVVDAKSRQLLAVQPEITKNQSTWAPYAAPAETTGNFLIDSWGMEYSFMPPSDFRLDPYSSSDLVSVADLFLIQALNLQPGTENARTNVTLHELENALSVLAASMFWTLGHIGPTHGAIDYPSVPEADASYSIAQVSKPLFLLQGNATVITVATQARLNACSSVVAIAAGLAASLGLMLLSLPSSISRRDTSDDQEISIEGTGILHAIWLYRNHPELEPRLEQVEYPTDENLRSAGMIRRRISA